MSYLLYLSSQGKSIHADQIRHSDNQVVALCSQRIKGFFSGRNTGDFRCFAQIQAVVFVDKLGGYAPVFFHNEGVVKTGHKKDFLNLERHQFMENFKMGIKGGWKDCGICCHWLSHHE